MTTTEIHNRAINCLKIRAEIHRRIRRDFQRVAELEAELLRLNDELKLVDGCNDKDGEQHKQNRSEFAGVLTRQILTSKRDISQLRSLSMVAEALHKATEVVICTFGAKVDDRTTTDVMDELIREFLGQIDRIPLKHGMTREEVIGSLKMLDLNESGQN
jgi:hypothetical protein